MTKEEMLKKVGLSEQEHDQLISRFAEFFNSLNEKQKKAVNNWLPKREEVAKSFGPDVTVEELKNLSNLENKCIGVAAIALKPAPTEEEK